jgi:hypothetical protein
MVFLSNFIDGVDEAEDPLLWLVLAALVLEPPSSSLLPQALAPSASTATHAAGVTQVLMSSPLRGRTVVQAPVDQNSCRGLWGLAFVPVRG